MTGSVPAPTLPAGVVLDAPTWRTRSVAHAARADNLTAGHRARRARGERHAIEDFLFEYYPAKPSMLRRWHPGVGVSLAPRAAWGTAQARVVGHGSVAISGLDVAHGPAAKSGSEASGGSGATGGSDVSESLTAMGGPDDSHGPAASRTPDVAEASGEGSSAPHTDWRWYRTDPDGTVTLDIPGFLTDRGDAVRYVHGLLSATAARPAATGCFGLHEWAMVYRQRDGEHRHPLALRLGGAGTDAVVEAHKIRCTHIDAFRFFTPRPRRATPSSRPARRRSRWDSRGVCTQTWTSWLAKQATLLRHLSKV